MIKESNGPRRSHQCTEPNSLYATCQGTRRACVWWVLSPNTSKSLPNHELPAGLPLAVGWEPCSNREGTAALRYIVEHSPANRRSILAQLFPAIVGARDVSSL